MSQKNAAFFSLSCSRQAATKLINNSWFKLSIFLSLALVIQTSGWNKSANALNIGKPLAGQISHLQRSLNSLEVRKDAAFLPKILNLLAFSNQSQPVVAEPKLHPTVKKQVKTTRSLPAIEDSSDVGDGQFSESSSLPIHQVKPGDTIYKIASLYRVSAKELIELNQIQDANLISVDRRLKIPATVNRPEQSEIANLPPAESQISSSQSTSSLSTTAKSSSLSVSSNDPAAVTSIDEDPYIANLRAEIDELRAQYKQERELKQNADSSVNSVSAVEAAQSTESIQPTSVASNLNSRSEPSSQINSPQADAIALTLPPLIDDEYLPSAFDGYAWPAQGVFTSGYGWRWGRLHRGIDIAAPIGTPIVAAASGKVVGAGWHGGYGNLIKLEHLDGSVTYYAHLNRISVTHGQQIQQGEQIAEMGSTGNSTGSHLHFEIHLRDRSIVNPLALLGSR